MERVDASSIAKWVVLGSLLLASCGRVIGADDRYKFDKPEVEPKPEVGCDADGCGESDAGSGSDCTRQSDCSVYESTPEICVREKCVRLKNNLVRTANAREGQCKLVLGVGALTWDAEPFVFGALSDLSTDLDLEAAPATKSYRLAINEFTGKGGLPIGGQSRAPVAVVCNIVNVTDGAVDETIDHLTNDLDLSLIIAPLGAPALRRNFERVRARGQSVFWLSPIESDSALDIEDENLLWHMTASPHELAAAYAPLIGLVENYLISAAGGAAKPPLRLALLGTNDSMESDIAERVYAELGFNGKTASENGPDQFLRLTVEDPASYEAALAKLKEFRPHIIVPVTHSVFFLTIADALEDSWSTIAPGQREPFYVAAPRHVFSDDLIRLLDEHPAARTRVAGVNNAAARDPRLLEDYLSRLQALYPGQSMINLKGQENFYDAVYFGSYAAAAGGVTPQVTGPDLAAGMLKLLSGQRIEVGPSDISNAMSYLVKFRSRIALNGTLGPSNDFDPDTGMRHGEGSVWCVADGPDGYDFRLDSLRMSLDGRRLEGKFECFPGFFEP